MNVSRHILTIGAGGLEGAPFLEQYFGPWAMLESAFMAGLEKLRTFDLKLHLQSAAPGEAQAAAGGSDFEVLDGGIAAISLVGSLMKQSSSYSSSSSTVAARRKVRAAMNDDNVSGILLRIDSPGGTVAGTRDLADDVAAASKRKPVYAYAEDLMASAAYWIGSQATHVFANPTAIVGSIGTYGVIYDLSKQAEAEGIKVHVIRAGDFKGAGVPGTEVTDAQLAESQRIVDSLNAHFLAGIVSGRRFSPDKAKQLADGRVHVGEAAQALGLIDGVQSLDATLSALIAASNPSKRRTKAMSENENTPKAATLAEIKAACTGADATFMMAQLEAGATLDQVRSNFTAKLQADLAAKNAEVAAAKAEADELKAQAAAAVKKPGAAPVTGSGKPAAEDAGDPIAAWNLKVAEKMNAGMSRAKAVQKCVAQFPEEHKAYLAAYNLENAHLKGGGNELVVVR